MTVPTQVSLDVPIAMPGVAPVDASVFTDVPATHLADPDRDFRILVDQVETLRVHLQLPRTAYFDELVRRLKTVAP